MTPVHVDRINARQASSVFRVKLATWKRWSREFLPPDPKARLRSGQTRLFSPNQAFEVFLGSHLVSFLGYSIPETRAIIGMLRPWLRKNGIYPDVSDLAPGVLRTMKRLQLIIHRKDDDTFCCESKHIVSVKPSTGQKKGNVIEEVYEQEWLPGASVDDMLRLRFVNFRVLEVGRLRETFDRTLASGESMEPQTLAKSLTT